jgi:hypothetical protein
MASPAELRAKLETLRRLRDEAEHDWDAQVARIPLGRWELVGVGLLAPESCESFGDIVVPRDPSA